MPTSAIGGLVEGLLQGQAIKQQKQQDRLNQERQHATDIFNQHVQTWRETQAQDEAKRTAEQQKFDNEISTKRQTNAEAEETRKVAADKQKREMSDAVINAKTDKQKQDALLKLYLTGGETLGSAAQIAGLSMGGQQAQPQQGALQGALNTLGSAGQGQAPIPNAGPLQQAPGSQPLSPIESLLQGQIPAVPRGLAEPGTPGYGAHVAPATAAKIKNTEAGTQQKIANTALLEDKHLHEVVRTALDKQRIDLEGKKGLKTVAETATINALRDLKVENLEAMTALAKVKADAAVAQTELTEERKKWLPVSEGIKQESLNLRKENDAFRRGIASENLNIRAVNVKKTIQNERSKAQEHYGKLDAQKIYWEGIAHINPATIDPVKGQKTLQQINMAPDILKGLQVQMDKAREHVNELSARGADIDKAIADTSTRTTPTGSTDKKLTDADRKAAAANAKRPPQLPPSRINLPGMEGDGQTPLFRSPPPAKKPDAKGKVKVGNDLRSLSTEELLKRLAKRAGQR